MERTVGGSLCRSVGTAVICFHRLVLNWHVSISKVVGSDVCRSWLAARSKARFVGIVGSNPAEGMDVCLL